MLMYITRGGGDDERPTQDTLMMKISTTSLVCGANKWRGSIKDGGRGGRV